MVDSHNNKLLPLAALAALAIALSDNPECRCNYSCRQKEELQRRKMEDKPRQQIEETRIYADQAKSLSA